MDAHEAAQVIYDAVDGNVDGFLTSDAEDILAALRDAGYEIVKLPEPVDQTANTATWTFEYGDTAGFRACVGYVSRNVGVVLRDGVPHDPCQARNLAAALLAAARTAEGQQ